MNAIQNLRPAITFAIALYMASCAGDNLSQNNQQAEIPMLVSTNPGQDTRLNAGLDTLSLLFDRNIFFSTDNTTKVTLNDQPVRSCAVIGSSNTLTVTADIPSADTVTLHIPSDLIHGPGNVPAREINVKWVGTPISLQTDISNPSATEEAKALFQLLYNNYGSKIFSGAMANVNWNTDGADQVYQITGEYPAISCFDYIHIPYSGQNWIDYDDLTPVTSWHDKGGIVAAMWHWLVPTQGLSADQTEMPADWSGSLQLTDVTSRVVLSEAKAGDKIIVHYNHAERGAQASFKNTNWNGLTDDNNISYEYFDIGTRYTTYGQATDTGASFELTLDDKLAQEVKEGIIISGKSYHITSVNYQADGEEEMTYDPESTTFDCSKVLVKGTLENKTMTRDLSEMASRLKALQDKNIAVLWRPLHEASGNTEKIPGGKAWFWWGAAGPETFKQLWQYMFSYFQQQGVNNLVWVWTGANYDSNWYPGNEYVDIIGTDIYNISNADDIASTFHKIQNTYPTKMVTLSECGNIPQISDIENAGGNWSWFMPWYGDDSEGTPHANDEWWRNAMSHDYVIKLKDLSQQP